MTQVQKSEKVVISYRLYERRSTTEGSIVKETQRTVSIIAAGEEDWRMDEGRGRIEDDGRER
jgi:hypothetical protein